MEKWFLKHLTGQKICENIKRQEIISLKAKLEKIMI